MASKRDWNPNKFPKCGKTFYLRCIFKIDPETLVVFGVKCSNCNTAKFSLRNNPTWKQRRHLIPMFIETPCIANQIILYQLKSRPSLTA